MNPLYFIGWCILVPIYKLMFFFKVNGKENVPKKGAYIICSNHLSNHDPIMLGVSFRRQIYYMAKAELFKNPFGAMIIRWLGAFPVQRGAGDGKAINEAEEVVKKGRLLGIFIEGTRSKTGEFLRPKSGAAMVAYQMNVPVIPVCITPKDKKYKLFKRVTVSIGKPMTPQELGLNKGSPEEFRNAGRMIMEEIKKMRENDLK